MQRDVLRQVCFAGISCMAMHERQSNAMASPCLQDMQVGPSTSLFWVSHDPPVLFQEAIRLRSLYLAVRRFQSDGYHDGDYASHAAWTYP